jgi:hypothetical protein
LSTQVETLEIIRNNPSVCIFCIDDSDKALGFVAQDCEIDNWIDATEKGVESRASFAILGLVLGSTEPLSGWTVEDIGMRIRAETKLVCGGRF